jgi:hypothetical protein
MTDEVLSKEFLKQFEIDVPGVGTMIPAFSLKHGAYHIGWRFDFNHLFTKEELESINPMIRKKAVAAFLKQGLIAITEQTIKIGQHLEEILKK